MDSRKRPGDKAFLLLRRAEGREPGNALTVNELIRAKSFLIDTDLERIADLHMVCRSRRSADPVGFDATWRQRSGIIRPSGSRSMNRTCRSCCQWIDTEPLESARDFLREHIEGLHPESSSVALDEIALMLNDPSSSEPFRNLLGRAFAVGVDEAYRPSFAKRLLYNWMSSDAATTRTCFWSVARNCSETTSKRHCAPFWPTSRKILNLSSPRRYWIWPALAEKIWLSRRWRIRLGSQPCCLTWLVPGTRLRSMRWRQSCSFRRSIPKGRWPVSTRLSLWLSGISRTKRLTLWSRLAVWTRHRLPAWLALLVELAAEHPDDLIPLSHALIAPLPPEAADA